MEEASGRNHGGGIIEEKAWRRNHGGGIMEEVSLGGIMEEESWRRNHGGAIWEASWRHLGGIWTASTLGFPPWPQTQTIKDKGRQTDR